MSMVQVTENTENLSINMEIVKLVSEPNVKVKSHSVIL